MSTLKALYKHEEARRWAKWVWDLFSWPTDFVVDPATAPARDMVDAIIEIAREDPAGYPSRCMRCRETLTFVDSGAPRFLHPSGEAICLIDNDFGEQDSGVPDCMPDEVQFEFYEEVYGLDEARKMMDDQTYDPTDARDYPSSPPPSPPPG